MSKKIKGSSCVRCHAYLFEEDDIVYCPVCGAPHHRDCYQALGHCALEELHGTDHEYSKEEEDSREDAAFDNKTAKSGTVTVCTMCGEHYSVDLQRCPKCGTPDLNRIAGYTQFDFLGGVPADYKLDQNVTAEDAKKFVVANTHRYIPKFATLSRKNKVSWNWMAFLFPSGWMLSRKMFKNGIIFGILGIITSLFYYPFNLQITNLGGSQTTTYPELVSEFFSLGKTAWVVFIFALLGMLFDLCVRVVSALYGDYWYKNHSITSIQKIKSKSEDIDYDYRKKGGVNIFFFFLAYFALQYLPRIIVMFI